MTNNGQEPPRGTLTQLWNATGSEAETLALAYPGIPEDTTFQKLAEYFTAQRLDTVGQRVDEELDRIRVREEAKRRYAEDPNGDGTVTRVPLKDRLLSVSGLSSIGAVEPLVDGVIYRDTLA